MAERKRIFTSSDPNVDFGRLGGFFEKHHIDRLMAYVKSIGSSRHQWQVERNADYQERYPHGFDLFPEVVSAARRHGLELFGQFKPFEAMPRYFPHTLPSVPGSEWVDLYGRLIRIPPFVAEHPEFCMKRWPGEDDPGGPISTIRLVKGDAAPTAIRKEHLSLWTTDQLGRWDRCEQDFDLEETVEEIAFFPRAKRARVLNLTGLTLPPEVRYIEVRLSEDCPETDFTTPLDRFVELLGPSGQPLPSTPALKDPPPAIPPKDSHTRPTIRYLQDEAAQRFADSPAALEHLENMRSVSPARIGQTYAFHEARRATVARGKQPAIPLLNPAHPEVRKHWLSEVEYMLDCGADGVNIRPSSHYHFWCKEPWAFGYNDVVLEQVSEPLNIAEVAEVNGKGFDKMLGEAAELCHSRGKTLSVHVLTNAFHAQNSVGKILNFANFNWNWKRWIREFVDCIELRGIGACYGPVLREMVDQVALECERAGKHFTLQCDRAIVKHTDPIFEWENEMKWALRHPGVHSYCLWETGFFSRFREDGEFHGPPSLKPALERHLSAAEAKPQ